MKKPAAETSGPLPGDPAGRPWKRITDIVGAFFGLILFLPVFVVLTTWILLVSGHPVIHWSRRIGRHNREFCMPKIRTMSTRTPQVASHLLRDPGLHLLPGGRRIRQWSLDEIPQLWCVLTGKMSLVGPRPALFNQTDLREARTLLGVHRLNPGITGWAQIHGRDELSISEKVQKDHFYLQNLSLLLDLKILGLTFFKVVFKEGVSH